MISKELEAKIMNAENMDEIVEICVAEGIDVTKEQLEAEVAKQQAAAADGELDEDALDAVSGGSAALLVIGVACAICIWQAKKEANKFAASYGKKKK